jgi:hypothetical protein
MLSYNEAHTSGYSLITWAVWDTIEICAQACILAAILGLAILMLFPGPF